MRFLSIDLGGKRTGIAVGDDDLRIATPAAVIVTANRDELLRQIDQAIKTHGAEALVLGLPMNMDGTIGKQAKGSQALAEVLRQRTGLEVHLVDERLTSAQANDEMAGMGLTHKQKKNLRDALAAAAILRDFFSRMDATGGDEADRV